MQVLSQPNPVLERRGFLSIAKPPNTNMFSFQLNTNSSDPLGDESTLSDLATDASSEPIVIDPDSDSVEKAAGNLNSSDLDSTASTSSSMATHSSSNPAGPPGAADSIEVEENPIGSGDEQQMHRLVDLDLPSLQHGGWSI